jgi:hypothetical protein
MSPESEFDADSKYVTIFLEFSGNIMDKHTILSLHYLFFTMLYEHTTKIFNFLCDNS